jgi:hypothetical protein
MKNKTDLIWILLIVLISSTYVYFATIANIDLTDGRFALFMDEKVTFDGVLKILYPKNIESFFYNLYNGNDHRYGRSLWNSISLFSFAPTYLFNVQGQIISARMLQVLLLICSFLLLCLAFLKTWVYRFCLLLLLLTFPFTDYYSTMPKPEPLQLLFISLFLYSYNESGMQFREKHWLFLGLALGTKISILPFIVILAFWFLWAELKRYPISLLFDKFIMALGYFLAGLALAVPILFPAFIITILIYRTTLYLIKHKVILKSENLIWVKVILLFLISTGTIFWSYLNYTLGGKSGIASWGGAIIMNANNAADLPSINFITWLKYLIIKWINLPFISTFFIGTTFMLFISVITRKIILSIRKSIEMKFLFAGIIMLAGLLLCLSIMLSVHRLWGFYLFTGGILFLSGFFSLIEQYFYLNNKLFNNSKIKLFTLTTLTISFCLLTISWVPNSIKNYRSLSTRTITEQYKKNYESYILTDSVIKYYSKNSKKKMTISIDPELFIPDNKSNKYTIVEFWGPFNWDSTFDIVILGPSHLPGSISIKKESPLYKHFLKESLGYSRYVVGKDSGFQKSFCYERILRLPNDGEILILKQPLMFKN